MEEKLIELEQEPPGEQNRIFMQRISDKSRKTTESALFDIKRMKIKREF